MIAQTADLALACGDARFLVKVFACAALAAIAAVVITICIVHRNAARASLRRDDAMLCILDDVPPRCGHPSGACKEPCNCDYAEKCKRLRANPTPCLCCPGECAGEVLA